MAKTDWNLNDTVLPSDMNQIGQEINELGEAVGSIDVTPPDGSVTYAKLAGDVKSLVTVNFVPNESDINTLTVTGLYRVWHGTNAPHGNEVFTYHVVAFNSSNIIQTAYAKTTNAIFTRRCSEGSWTPWYSITNQSRKLISADANNVLTPGNFVLEAASNVPNGIVHGYLTVYRFEDNPVWFTQVLRDFNSTTIYERRMYNGTWDIWVRTDNGTITMPAQTELTALTRTGKYYVYDATGAYDYNVSCYIDVIANPSAGYLTQTAYDLGYGGTWTRRRVGDSGWTSWIRLDKENTTGLSAVTDLNTILETGTYYGYDLANAPASLVGSWMYVDVIAHNSNWVTQTVYQFVTQETWTRRKVDGVWYSWVALHQTYYVPGDQVEIARYTTPLIVESHSSGGSSRYLGHRFYIPYEGRYRIRGSFKVNAPALSSPTASIFVDVGTGAWGGLVAQTTSTTPVAFIYDTTIINDVSNPYISVICSCNRGTGDYMNSATLIDAYIVGSKTYHSEKTVKVQTPIYNN